METNDSNPKVEIVFEVDDYERGSIVGQSNITASLEELLEDVGREDISGNSPGFLLSYLGHKIQSWEIFTYDVHLTRIIVDGITVWERKQSQKRA